MGKYCSGKALSVFLAVLLGVLGSGFTAQAQAPATPAAPATTTPSQTEAAKESLPIGPGDTVHVTFFDEPNLEQRVRVSDAGEVSLTLIGNIHVAGLTPPQAATAIANRYKQGGFLNNPQVQIFVEQYATENVSVIGQVRLPGPVALPTPKNVLDVLALAGGLTELAERNITIQRMNGEKVRVLISNNADVALEAAKIIVYPGDIVLVPKAGIVYVLGDVGRPGGFVMQDDSKASVLQALALAGGTNKTASEGSARLLRHESAGLVTDKIRLNDMQKGKIPDIQMQNDDILWVPFSFSKNIAVNLPSILASAGSAAIYNVGR